MLQGKQAFFFPEVLNSNDHLSDIPRLKGEDNSVVAVINEYATTFPETSLPASTVSNGETAQFNVWLPITAINAPSQIISSQMKPFSDNNVLVVYKNNPTEVITLALTIRNSPTSPWLAFYEKVLLQVRESTQDVSLVLPKLSTRIGEENKDEVAMAVRVVNFAVANKAQTFTTGVLTLVASEQGPDSTKKLGGGRNA
jgi:hypothetical protein